jgi:hypothetical protein
MSSQQQMYGHHNNRIGYVIEPSYRHLVFLNSIINDPNFNNNIISNINNNININDNDMLNPRTNRSNKPREKSKAISKNKLEESCPTECAICQETPNYEDAVCTKCNHYYCKKCWDCWMDAPTSNKSCPTCRNDKPQAASFRARASHKQKPNNFEYHNIYPV